MITDKDKNVIYFSKKLEELFSETANRIFVSLKLLGVEPQMLEFTNDIWARDYMPIQVNEHKYIQYKYEPDYLKNYIHLQTDPESVCKELNLNTIVHTDVILDGGNVVKSSNCIILTDKVLVENKHKYTKEQLLDELRMLFDVEKVVLIPWDKGEKYGHSDGMIRFIDNETVLLQGYFNSYKGLFKDEFINTLFGVLKANNLKWEFLNVDYTKKINQKFAYLNYLQTKDIILLPSLGIDEDDEIVEKKIKECFPDYKDRIRKVKMNNIIAKGGALNCISWTLKK